MSTTALASPAIAVGNLTTDINHSSLEFSVRYLGTSRIRGRVDALGGHLTGEISLLTAPAETT